MNKKETKRILFSLICVCICFESMLYAQTLPDFSKLHFGCDGNSITAAVALIAILTCHFYPLTTERVTDISRQLKEARNADVS